MTSSDNTVVGAVMVAGAGIAGIQAALDLANSGFRVYLLDKNSAIGGVMAQLDKTFPTNDCSMCIISPKLVEAGRHLNIELLTQTEIEAIRGEAGNFEVEVRVQPRYVDLEKCTACGECAKVCPVELPNAFDQGLRNRQAAYKLYPQGMPGAYTIDKQDQAPCRLACPAGLNVQGYVQMVKQGQFQEALQIIMADLPLPGVLGRICPHDCENVCRRRELDQPVAIRNLKRLAADQCDPRSIEVDCAPPRPEQVAIVGSGPAGLAAAYHLARQGIRAVIFEALPQAGGMLRVGIPDHRLPKAILDQEIEVITRLGVEIRLNTPLGPNLTIDDLFDQGFRAVFLAVGAHTGYALGIPDEDGTGVRQGVDFLREVNLSGQTPLGRRVAIIGGGNVAVDVARCAVRLGAEEVQIIYRRTRREMPAWEEEIDAAETEGVHITYLAAPQAVLTENGQVIGLRCIRMALTDPDESGRRRPVPIEGSEYDIPVDQVIPAIGQRPDLTALAKTTDIHTTRWGTIEVDPLTLTTSREGVFAGGDAQTGPGIAIGAIAMGKTAAESIVRYIEGRDLREGREARGTDHPVYRPVPQNLPPQARTAMPELPTAARAGNFREVELGYAPSEGQAEAARCINCGSCCECYQCVKACLAQAIDHNMKPEVRRIAAGAVILAPGFTPFDPAPYLPFNYGHPNVVSSLDFERLLSASGPFEGHLVRPSDHQPPRKIAWLQCIGSRDQNLCGREYCSSVCCMYAVKQTVIAKEHSATPLDTAVFYMDMRTHGKDFDKYFLRARDENGVRFVQARIHTLEPMPEDRLKLRYSTAAGELMEETFDMAVLSVGLSPPDTAADLARRLGIPLDTHGFAATTDLAPVSTPREGIFVCGVFQGPKDIPQSVMEASAAAAEASRLLAPARESLVREPELPPERDVSAELPRIAVFVCHCGINIGGIADVPGIRDYAAGLPHVVHVEDNLFTCAQDSQDRMKALIQEKNINRVVVASCSPRTHEPLFQETIRAAGLNPYLFEMANIRDQNTWVHMQHPQTATRKAKDLLRMAVARAAHGAALHKVSLDIVQSLLVVGGGVAGMEVALGVADQGYQVYLVEREGALGGVARQLQATWRGESIPEYLERLKRQVHHHPRIRLFLHTEPVETTGALGHFQTDLLTGKATVTSTTVTHGATVIATGGKAYIPTEYLYGQHPAVMTHLELDAALDAAEARVQDARVIVFIQCVGSRTPERPYCSRVCCVHSLKSAMALKDADPRRQVFVLYRDLRTYGLRETLYTEARRKGVIFIRFHLEQPPDVRVEEDQLTLEVMEPILNRPLIIQPDLLVLATAILPHANRDLFEAFKVPVNSDGFLVEAHAKLRPVDFASEGIFMAGLAHGPKPVDETIAQARAAVSRAVTILSCRQIQVGGVVAHVHDPEHCACCLVCVRSCPYGVPAVRDGRAVIEPAQCHGCGICAAECTAKVITLQHYTDEQILSKTSAFMNETPAVAAAA